MKGPYFSFFNFVTSFSSLLGFTSLTEKYSMNSKNGTDQLTKTLNGYMRALVSEIILYDGDVLKFAGKVEFLSASSSEAHPSADPFYRSLFFVSRFS